MADTAVEENKASSSASSSPSSSPPPPPPLHPTAPPPASAAASGPIICPGHSRPVPDVAFTGITPDGYFLISACLDNKAMLRDGVTGDWIGTFIGHKGAVWCARLNQEATKAVTGAADFSAKLWDALTGDELHNWNHRHIVKSVTFSQAGGHVFTGGHEKKIRLFDLNQPDAEPQILEGHTGTITQIIALPDEHLIASAAQEKDIRIWDLRTGSVCQSIQTDSVVKGAQLSIDTSTLTFCTDNKQVSFYAIPSFTPLQTHTLQQNVDCVSYSPTTGVFVTGSDSELWARLWRFSDATELAVNKGHHGPVRSVCFAPDGSAYVSGSEDGTIRIWNNIAANKATSNQPSNSSNSNSSSNNSQATSQNTTNHIQNNHQS